MNFRRYNTLLGWLCFVIAFTVYSLTAERSASFWDCGEFISASYKLQVVHPPGAPFFLLLGNLFSNFAFGNTAYIALAVNMLSVTMSSLCVMFSFWVGTHYAAKLLAGADMREPYRRVLIFGSGLVGALTLTFTDTFWFSAVEAEVYAASSFFTALTFWCILKWENVADQPMSDRWLILIAYLIGLAIGVHLLNIMVIPAIVYVYYFRRFKTSTRGLLISTLIGLSILALVQFGIIPGLPALAAAFDIYFVNSLGLGFGSGVLSFTLLLVGLLALGIYLSERHHKVVLNTALLCATFVLIGYSSYTMVVVRSLANPPIDMNNPEEPLNLLSYLNREQYGDRPLLKGPYFNAPITDFEKGKADYRKGKESYELSGYNHLPVYDENYVTLFPRMGDNRKAEGYRYWCGVAKDEKPSFADNLEFFFNYQLGFMYWRYFLWNFAGRQSNIQGEGDPLNGNWMSGIAMLDAIRLGPQSDIPGYMQNNPGRNTYFMLPLILGLAGLIYQFQKRMTDFFVIILLFLFTGILISIYLNAPPFEPRERDYTLVGSFQVFCIWIGLGIIQLSVWLKMKFSEKVSVNVAVIAGLLLSPCLLAFQNWDDHDRSGRTMVMDFAKDYLESCEKNAILLTNGDNDTYPLWYAQNVEGFRTDVRVVNLQLLNYDWCINALRRKEYDSDSFHLSVDPAKYVQGLREEIIFASGAGLDIPQDEYFSVPEIIRFICTDNDDRAKVELTTGDKVNFLPVKNLYIDVNRETALASGTVPQEDSSFMVKRMRFTLPEGLLKAEWILLDLIAQNNFKRPVYFSSNSVSSDFLGLSKYLRLDGLAYRLVPVEKPEDPNARVNLNTNVLYDRMMNRYGYGNLSDENTIQDDQSIMMAKTFRNYAGLLALKLAEKGMKDSAVRVADRIRAEIPGKTIPYEMLVYASRLIQAYYLAGQPQKGAELLQEFVMEEAERLQYFRRFNTRNFRQARFFTTDSEESLKACMGMAQKYGETKLLKEIESILNERRRGI